MTTKNPAAVALGALGGAVTSDAKAQAARANGTLGGRPRKSAHPLYGTWTGILSRCTNQTDVGYANYGGRGISVCERWQGPDGFANFLADMGDKPTPKHSIDRIDVNGNYEPSNCRWATHAEQMANRRRVGRVPRSGSAATIRVTIRLTSAEHAAWLERAGDKPLGVWIRERCNNERVRK